MLNEVPVLGAVAVSLAGAAVMIAWRVRETRAAVSVRSILLPPLGMSTGFIMFAVPDMRVPLAWGLAAFLAGALVLFYPLSRTSRLARAGERVVMQRSRTFLLILLALVALRIALREYIGAFVSPAQSAALLFTLSFGMVLRWRAGMLRDYLRLRVEAAPEPG